MRLYPRHLPLILVAVCLSWSPASGAQPQTAAEARVRSALESLHHWIGGGPKDEGWREYLMTDQLQRQLDRGAQADRRVVSQILERYSGDARGLEMRRFREVRRALEAWLEELPPLNPDQLPEAARQAREQFRPLTEADVQQARQQLQHAMADLERLMARWLPANREAWRQYLAWEELNRQAQADEPDLRALQSASENFFRNHEGLELPQFTAVRDALRRYVNWALFAANPKAGEFYQKYLEDLAQRLEAYRENPDVEDAAMIGQILGWLERFNQASELVAAVRQHHSRPNLLVQVSADMLRSGIETAVDERTGVREVILGTQIRGVARMRGQVALNLVPSEQQAAIDLLLNGTVHSNNTGYNGPVKILSTGVTTVSARKRILVDDEGIGSQYARASARTRTNINRIITNSHLIQHIAWKRARQSKSQAESIASGRAQRRVAGRMDAQIADQLQPAREAFAERFRNPLLRRGGFPQLFALSTSEDFLFVRALQAGGDQLAAPNEPPDLTQDHDLAVRMHQSLVGNMAQALLGGMTFTDERMAEIAEQLFGEVPEELRITPESDPWSITFASERPVEARFEDQHATFFVRARQFTRGDQTLRERIEVSARYAVEKTPLGARLTRQGDLDVVFGDRRRLSVGNVAMKTFVRRKFEDLFKPQFESDGLELPGRWGEAGKLRLDQLHCDGGWVALGWDHPAGETRIASRETNASAGAE